MNPRWVPLVLLGVILLAVALSGLAAGHAEYVSSSPPANGILPSAPSEVDITLSEAIQAGSGTIRVTNTTGARFDVPPVGLQGDGRTMSVALNGTGPGIYTVTWTALSAVDGHFTAGSFSFAVQNPDGTLPGPLPQGGPTASSAPVSPAEVGFRFIGYIGLSVALGVAFLATFMWLPAGRDPDVRQARAYDLGLQVLLNVGRIAALAFGIGKVGLFVLATNLEGATTLAGIVNSPYVRSVAIRLALAAALFIALTIAFNRSRAGTTDACLRPLQFSVITALAAILAGSFGTHAAADPSLAAVGVAADTAHLIGVGLWVGGLAGIVSVRSVLREDPAIPLARIVFGRFSRLTAYAVGLVLAGGLTLTLLLVRTWDGLLGTSYGWIVLAKISLFIPMVLVGAFNRYRLVPRLAKSDDPNGAVRRLAQHVKAETALGVTVLLLAGLLTSMTPAGTLVSGTPAAFDLQMTADGLAVDLQVFPYPTLPGLYTFSILLNYASNGTPYNGARNGTGTLTFTLVNGNLSAQSVPLDGPHGNHFVVTTSAMSRVGIWRVDLGFQRIDAFDFRGTFNIAIHGSG